MLEVRDVTFRYGETLMRFSLTVERGCCQAVIGPSGAGKSTLLALIAGFAVPESGAVFIDGEAVTGLPPARRPVTSLFQEHNLFAHLTVFQNIGLGLDPGLRLTAEETATLQAALEKVGLKGMEQRLPAALSGGQRQRVALARSLVRRKPVLLLDEPFSALDPGLRAEMLDLVDQLRREQNLVVVMVSHAPGDARRIAGRTAFVHAGRVLAEGETGPLLDSAENQELRAFLGPG